MANKCCVDCGAQIERGLKCPSCYAYYRKHPEGLYPLPLPGHIDLAINGDPICHICGQAHRKLGNHISFKHHMTLNEYKDKFKLYRYTQLTNEAYKNKMRKYSKKYYRKCIKKNLLKLGKGTRFIQGREVEGRGKHIKEFKKNV